MRVPRIFQDIPLEIYKRVWLDEGATRHLMSVLRLKVGDKLILFNGDGLEYPSLISQLTSRKLEVEIKERVEKTVESPVTLHLGQVISKGERMDYTLQKATELGVSEITPLFSIRSEVHLKGEREERKMAHWQKVLISACEQCGRNRIPTLYSPKKVEIWVNAMKQDQVETKLFLDHRSQASLKQAPLSRSIALLIGPEGGLTFEEKHYAEQKGFQGLRLGPRILRTETAGVVAISLLQYLTGDLS